MAWESLSFESARNVCLARHVHDDAGDNLELSPRNLLFKLVRGTGELCLSFNRSHDDCTRGLVRFTRSEKDKVASDLSNCFTMVLLLAERCNIDLPLSIQLKIKLNARKYPVGIVKGSALKYDAYHATTGYGKGSKQVTTEGENGDRHLSGSIGQPWNDYDMENLRVELEQFAERRNWAQFHTPRNLSLALCGEVGELCELFQFKNEDDCFTGLLGWKKEERDKLSQELSDVCIYLVRLSDVCETNLSAVLLNKYDSVGRSSQQSGHSTYYGGYPWLGGCLLFGLAAAVMLANRRRC